MHLWLDERLLVVEGSKELRGDWAAKEGVQGRLRDPPRSSDSCGGGEGWTSWPWGAHHMLPGQWSRTFLPLLGEGGGQARPSVPLPVPALPSLPRPLPSPHPVSQAGRWAAGLSRCILPLPLPSLAPRQPHPVVPPSIYGSPAPPAGPAGPFPGKAGPQWKVVEKCGQISDLQHSGKEFIAIV